VREPQPPPWWQPPREPLVPAGPVRPQYREVRPVRWPMVGLGVACGVLWFAVVAIASSGALLAGVLAGLFAGTAATAVLAWKGDLGLSIGAGIVVGFVLAVTIVIGSSSLFGSLN
jgi:hypothetical protein